LLKNNRPTLGKQNGTTVLLSFALFSWFWWVNSFWMAHQCIKVL